jgi:hypothetical protein
VNDKREDTLIWEAAGTGYWADKGANQQETREAQQIEDRGWRKTYREVGRFIQPYLDGTFTDYEHKDKIRFYRGRSPAAVSEFLRVWDAFKKWDAEHHPDEAEDYRWDMKYMYFPKVYAGHTKGDNYPWPTFEQPGSEEEIDLDTLTLQIKHLMNPEGFATTI